MDIPARIAGHTMPAPLRMRREKGVQPVAQRGSPLTERERLSLEEQLKLESLARAKCDTYLGQCQDQELRGIVQGFRDSCQQHMDNLTRCLQDAGFSPPS